ncbi:TPA: MBL fold metallo-hydrolase [Vibrio parahaemolyticus]|uniref:MBL fold metallo-hydrolase n=1 Tax=Vibrio parahaemolyticus TaxID=670 RepID=UPI0011237BBA|nr:MBL fold metallo-hydrolase [Vibrio parahaemolyticus]TOB92667.1 MBL fold metallo-hydrolase [Vibrio parahaemolyticus]HCZ9679199.1 MBL fold metallo-hydrolase [Vibrio parahaemolyticus]HCZ9682803.1 MBL fold metallo-hydrolase [Vibrio parahaemolyticus]
MKKFTLIAASILMASPVLAANHSPLTLEVYNADGNSFHVNSTLVYGETDAMVIDTGFTKADAMRIAAKVLDSGKTLKTIFISQADPDYYFGAEALHQQFPDAQIIATPAVQKIIKEKLAGKLAYWGPKLGANAPVKPVIPVAYDKASLELEGHKIEIRGYHGTSAHRPYLWIPDNKAILGNVAVYSNVHLWMADAADQTAINAWEQQLSEMLALKPQVVIPGHMKAGTKLNADTIRYSQQYLQDFQQAKKHSNNSVQLIDTISAKYPEAQLPIALEIGAKVHTGEMSW